MAAVGASERPFADEFQAFFERHYRDLGRLAYLLTGDQEAAEEVTAEALLAAWRRWPRMRRGQGALTAVQALVVGAATVRGVSGGSAAATSWSGDARGHKRGSGACGAGAGPADPGRVPEVDQAAAAVRAALLGMSPRRRACLVLRHVLDRTDGEVARTLGISRRSARRACAEGLTQLQRRRDPGSLGGRGRRQEGNA